MRFSNLSLKITNDTNTMIYVVRMKARKFPVAIVDNKPRYVPFVWFVFFFHLCGRGKLRIASCAGFTLVLFTAVCYNSSQL
jgi:hypothetical protein